MTFDTVVSNCTVVTPEGRVGPDVAIGVTDGTVAAIGRPDALGSADEWIDAGGDYLVPGIVDTHVHQREPGYEHRETFETASRAAAAGGVTTFLAMPNTDPPVDTPEHLEVVCDLGAERSLVDFGVYGYLSPDNIDQIEPLADAGVIGFKAYLARSTTGMPVFSDGTLLDAMQVVAGTDKRLAFHAENNDILHHLEDRFEAEGRNAPIDHAHSRPVVAETEAISRVIRLAEATDCPIAIVHLSSGSGAALVERAREGEGIDVLGETCPHYLWFSESVLEEKGNVARINPPIKSAEEREKLWAEGIDGGGVDYLGTDHSPHTDEAKGMDDPFGDTWGINSGFAGVETQVSAMLTFVADGALSMERWVDFHSRRPAQVWGLYPRKGSLRIGTDADFTLFDPDETFTLDRSALHSKSTATPFDGETFTGRVTKTMIRGRLVYDEGEFPVEPGYGQVLRR